MSEHIIKEKEEAKRQTAFTDEELDVIKATFAENKALIKLIRNVILQLEVSENEQKMLEEVVSKNKAVLNILSKTLCPKLDGKTSLYFMGDLWSTAELTNRNIKDAMPLIRANQKFIDYMVQQINELSGKKDRKIVLAELTDFKDKSDEEIYADIIVRNTVLRHTEINLGQILLLAGLKNETSEETLVKLKRNSNK